MLNKMLIIIFTLVLPATIAWAGFTGPSTIIQGNWGTGDTDFGFESGDTMDSFPGLIVADEVGTIIIGDGVNFRIKVYDSLGNWRKNFSYKNITPIGGWPMNLKAKANIGIFSIYEKLQRYDYSGNLKMAVALTGYEDFWIIDDGGVWVQEFGKSKYNLYSPTGQLINTSATKPLELGKVSEQRLNDGKYKVTITYPDKVYSLIGGPYERYVRDQTGRVNAVSGKFVKKVNECGKELGRLSLPEDQSRVVRPGGGGFDERRALIAEYGEPVVAPNGDVYTWKRTPDTYSILKWTWVDDPSVPTGPDAPTGLTAMPSTTGIYLTWTASPNDPGCVTGYEVARATTSGGTFTTLPPIEKGVVKYNDTTAEAGQQYYYKVRAKAGSEYSPYTAEVPGKR